MKKTSSLASVVVLLITVVAGCASEAMPEHSASTQQAYTKGATTSGGTETPDEVTDDFVESSEKWSVQDCKDVCDIVTDWSPRSCADYCDCRIRVRTPAAECLRIYNLRL